MNEVYQEEGSTFTHAGVEYNLNFFLKRAHDLPVSSLPVKELDWMVGKTSNYDQARVEVADYDVPLLVTKWKTTWVTIDGFHRVVKALRDGKKVVPVKIIPEAWFSLPRAKVKRWRKRPY